MEDKELKKRLKKIPDVDKNGDPIYKIDDENAETPLFIQVTPEAPQGNDQDVQDKNTE